MTNKEIQNSENDTLISRLINEVRAIVNSDQVRPESTLGELGIDSVTVVDLMIVCEEIYREPIQPELLHIDEFTSLKALHTQIYSAQQSKQAKIQVLRSTT